jgi:trans-aconitate methyltransferase
MKLNLGCSGDLRSHGFINVDVVPNPTAPAEVYRQGDITNLDWLCPAGEADEIVAHNALPRLSYTIVDAVLEHWVSRLKPGGVLKITVPDLRGIAGSIVEDTIDLTKAATLLYGPQDGPQAGFRSAYESKALCDRLVSLGMRILVQRMAGFTAYIEAEKVGGK